MSFPGEVDARADLARQVGDLFARAERVHTAMVEVLTRGRFAVTKPAGSNKAVVFLIASLLTKACKTFRAIQLTAEGGLGQDAAVLARQLFETAVAISFILEKDDDTRNRAAMFAAHEDVRLLVLIEKASELEGLERTGSPENLEKQRGKVNSWEELIGAQALKSVRKHWSGRSLEWAATQVGYATAYALLYRVTSAFAHGSDASAHFFVKHADDTPTLKLAPGDDQVREVLRSSMALVLCALAAANDGFGLGEDEVVERIRREVAPLKGGE